MPIKRATFRQYYKEFLTLQGLRADVLFAFPLLGTFAPDPTTPTKYLYPPLGDWQQLALSITVLLLLAFTYVVFTRCPLTQRVRRRVVLILLVISLLSGGWLVALCGRYVRRIELKSTNQVVVVSIGSQRSAFALETYPPSKWNDWNMLHDSGPWEDQIQDLWTPESIRAARKLLWVSYTLTLACLVSIASFAVYQHAAEKAFRTEDSN